MKRLLAMLLLVPGCCTSVCWGQSACAQLGVDCSHPDHPQPDWTGCDADCRQQRAEAAGAAEARREYKNFWKAVGLAGKAEKAEKSNNLEQGLQYIDQALALRRVAGSTAKQDQWAWDECERGDILLKLGKLDAAADSYSRCGLEDVAFKTWQAFHDWSVRGGALVEWNSHPWSPKAFDVRGNVTIITADGREWHGNFTQANFRGARLKTGPGARAEFHLPDDTRFTVGPNSDMVMDDFVFNTKVDVWDFVWQVTTGTFRFLTGYSKAESTHLLIRLNLVPPNGAVPTGNPCYYENKSYYEVLSGSLCVVSLGVRGTDFSVSAGDDIVVALREGIVDYVSPDTKLTVMQPGSQLVFQRDGSPAVYTWHGIASLQGTWDGTLCVGEGYDFRSATYSFPFRLVFNEGQVTISGIHGASDTVPYTVGLSGIADFEVGLHDFRGEVPPAVAGDQSLWGLKVGVGFDDGKNLGLNGPITAPNMLISAVMGLNSNNQGLHPYFAAFQRSADPTLKDFAATHPTGVCKQVK